MQAHVPRDIVYSLIGVASQNCTLELAPDYGTSWEDLYTPTAKKIITKTRNVKILGYASEHAGRSAHLPTWVPDWRVHQFSGARFSSVEPPSRKYYSSGSSLVVLGPNGNPAKLEVRGVRVDKINHVGLSEESLDGLLRSSKILHSEFPNRHRRQIFTTSKGSVGVGPRDMKVGDCIFILLGAELPILLRRESHRTEYFLVGKCFVNGLMQGERLLKARKLADPSYDLEDTAWLMRLHEEDVPFPMEDVVII